jgi:cathepsin A (carboxypeptidase C)
MLYSILAPLAFQVLQEREHGSVATSTICDSVKQYTGYYKLSDGVLPKNYFYWAFESRSKPESDPVVLWMTGGPGCSSEVALFGENGPCQVNEDGSDTVNNPYSWNSNATLIYIDQPAGTGFSYGAGTDHDETGVAADMYDFLQQFFKAHESQGFQERDFFVFGESYAGHYVPAVTHLIWKNNQNLPSGAIKINLKGTSVGNGLTDPSVQYQYYAAMAASTNHHEPAVNKTGYEIMEAITPVCTAAIDACQKLASACLIATDICNLALIEPYQLSGRNPYDMRIKCAVPPLCYDFSNVQKYLSRPEVVQYLGVEGHKWTDCNHGVAIGFELDGDWMHDYQDDIPDQLAAGIRVLMYAGDQDYICNWLGNQAWTLALDWPGKQKFNANSSQTEWMVDGEAAGTLRSSGGFSFLRVYDAGHMVPRDQPKHALAMLNAFIMNTL